MNVTWIITALWILTGALAIRLLMSWDQLPESVAVHFDIGMEPNGWSSKRGLALIVLLPVLGTAVLASWLLVHLGSAAVMAGFTLLAVQVVMVSAFWQMISYNALGTPFRSRWIILPLVIVFSAMAAMVISQSSVYHRH